MLVNPTSATEAILRQIATGEQPSPVFTGLASCHELAAKRLKDDRVIVMLRARQALGINRYGQPLTAHNGRDSKTDLIQELLDAIAYTAQFSEDTGRNMDLMIWQLEEMIADLLDFNPETREFCCRG